MKSILIIVVLCVLYLQSLNAQWQQVFNTSTVFSLGTHNVSNVFAGTSSGMYISPNEGITWFPTSFNVTQPVQAILSSGTYLFAGTSSGHGVYRSSNDGNTWVSTTLNSRVVYSLASPFPGNGNIFAGTNSYGVYKSTNYGVSWTQTSLNSLNVHSLACYGNNVFAGTTNSSGLYRSENAGISWTVTPLNNIDINALAISMTNGTIFAGTPNGVYVSVNGGNSFSHTLSSQPIKSLIVNSDSILAGTANSGVFVSKNNGSTWTQRIEGMGNIPISSFCFTSIMLFAGCDANAGKGIYRRAPNGFTGISLITAEIPSEFSLEQNYPNPFNPNTKIEFAIPKDGFVTLKIYDMLGREVSSLVSEDMKTGSYTVDFDASKYSTGVYFYRLNAGDFADTKKMMLVK